MTKGKNSVSSKLLAVLLVISILISTIQPTVAKAVENTNTVGTIATLVNGGEINGNTVTFSGTKLTWSPKNEAIGRNVDGWWVGIQVNAPEGMDSEQLKNSKYKYANSTESKSFWTYKDSADDAESHNIQLWGVVNEEYLINAIANDKTVDYKYEFDWNNDGTYEQPITMSADPNEIILVKDGIEVYPNYATVTPLTGGTVSGDATNLELVIDEAILNWSDVDESVGRHTAGWWVGMKVTAPVGYTADELQKAYYNRKVTSSTSDTGWSEATKVEFWGAKDSADADVVHHIQMWMVINPSLIEKYQGLTRNISTSYEFDWNNDGNTDQTIKLTVVPSEKIVLNKVAPEFEVEDIDITYGTKPHKIVINEIKVGDGKYVFSIEGENNIGASVDENGVIEFTDSEAKVGSITVKVKKEADDTFSELEKTFKVNVSYHETTVNPAVDGQKVEGSAWYSSVVTIKAPDGYVISASGNKLTTSDWADSVAINTDGVIASKYVYLKSVADGFITDGIEIKDIKIDTVVPAATLKIEDSEQTIWDKIIDVVTFGIFTNKEEKMIINATDNMSGIKTIHGYELDVKEKETTAEIEEKLLNVAEDDWTELYTATEEQQNASGVEGKVPAENKNIIYCVKVVDYAGNAVMVTSDGMIFDIKEPTPVLTDNKLVFPKTAPTHTAADGTTPQFGIADTKEVEGKIRFNVAVTESNIGEVLQSGIKKVSYTLKNKASEEAAWNDVTPTENDANVLCQWTEGEALITEYTGTIDVDAAGNNYNYVELIVIVEDNAGNIYDETYAFAIDVTEPEIDGKATPAYWTNQKVVISGVASDTPSGIESITWKKADGSANGKANYDKESNTYSFGIGAESYKGNYEITCVDYAGNETKINVAVQMDKDAPTATLQIETVETDPEPKKEIWEEIIDFVTFGIFTNKDEKMIITAIDNLSGIKTIHGYELDVKGGETKAEIQEKLLNVVEKDWTELYTATEDQTNASDVEGPVLKDNKNIIYCVRVADYAGNEHYVTSNGMIFDIKDPAGGFGGLDDKAMLLPQQLPMNGEEVVYVPNDNEEAKRPLYGKTAVGEDGVVTFDVNISEETIDGVLQSGIKKVSYKVEAKDRNGFDKDGNEYQYVITQGAKHEEATVVNGGLLCQWTEREALITEYEGTIDVVAADNNHNYVRVTVTVEDNAGNIVSETYEFAIDLIAPTVKIEYNSIEPVAVDDERGYFNYQRIAKITYTERSENWNAEEAERGMITALDINDNKVDRSYTISEWTTVEGETSDTDSHFAIVSFNPTNILEIKDEGEDEVADGDDTVGTEGPEDTIQPVEPVAGADARYKLDLSYKDAAGNAIAVDEKGELIVQGAEVAVHPFEFVIDTVKPELVEVVYEEQIGDTVLDVLTFNMFRYFGNNATVKITVKDETAGLKTFDFEGILDEGVSLKNKAVEKTIIEKLEQAETDGKESKELTIVQQKDKSKFVIEFKIPKEILTAENSFRGSLVVNAHDYCKNTSEPGVGTDTQGNESYIPNTKLVVDKIAPTCQVTFDQPVNEVEGVSYYDKSFTATIVIDEANFYKEDVEISINGTRVMPTDWTQTPGTDIWTSHVSFIEENDYILTVNYTDRSGNVMTTYESNQRTLDTTEPVISVSNIKHESANNEETIGFVLTVTDKNMALANVKPQATAVIREGDSSANYTYKTVNIELGTPAVTTNANGETVYTYTVTNLEIDGYYSLVCTVVDHANHTVSNIGSQSEDNRGVAVETVNFSVNRGGSVFWIETIHNDKYSDTTFNNELNGAYANDEVTVKLHEVNVDRVDELEADDKRTVLTLNDGNDSNTIELVENSNGNGNYERNVRIGEGGWYETIYTLGNDQFAKDGTYSLNIITYDKAENSNVNTNMKNEEGTIQFVVDRTNPVITTNVKSKQIIDANEYTVELTIAEVNLDESTLVVKLEGNEVEWTKVSNNTYQFTLDEAQWENFPRLSQDFEITAKDLAGNSAEVYQREDITVTDDVIIQVAAYMINRPVLLGVTGAGVVAITGLIIFLIVWKKRRKDEA